MHSDSDSEVSIITQVIRKSGVSQMPSPPRIPDFDSALSREDRRALIRWNRLVKSIDNFAENCYQFNFSVESTGEARSLQHRYNISVSPCINELKQLVETIEDEHLYDDVSLQAQQVTDECHQAYSKILAYLDNAHKTQNSQFSDPRLETSVTRRSPEIDEIKLCTALLPSVPVFEGDITKFSEFKISFGHAVHNRKISTNQKLSALRSKLRGTPLKLIEHFGSSENDYDLAYQTLTDYYTGKNRVAAALVTSFLELQKLENYGKYGLQTLETFYSKSKNLTSALVNLDLSDLGDFFMFTHIFNLMPNSLRDKFIEDQNDFANEVPTTQKLLSFLAEKLIVLRAQPEKRRDEPGHRSPSPARSNPFNRSNKMVTGSTALTASQFQRVHTAKCYFCDQFHFIYHCGSFKESDYQARLDFVNRIRLCHVCLSHKHESKACPSLRKCTKCNGRHHVLLHADSSRSNYRPNSPTLNRRQSVPKNSNPSVQISSVPSCSNPTYYHQEKFPDYQQEDNVSLADKEDSLIGRMTPLAKSSDSDTAPISSSWYHGLHAAQSNVVVGNRSSETLNSVPTNSNEWHQARAILDTGSEANLISLACAERVGMSVTPMKSHVAGVGGTTSTRVHGCSCALVQQRYGYPNLLIPFLVVSKVTLDLPSTPLPRLYWSHLEDLDLADPQFHVPSSIDIIFSGDIMNTINLHNVKFGLRGSPFAHLTSLGWLISGGYTRPGSAQVRFSPIVQEQEIADDPLPIHGRPEITSFNSSFGTRRNTRDGLSYLSSRPNHLPIHIFNSRTRGKVLPTSIVLAPTAEMLTDDSHSSPPPEYAELLNLMFRIESVEDRPPLTTDELRAEELFRKTVTRLNDGRFEVALPFKKDPSVLGDSKTTALKRMRSLEHRLSKSPGARSSYNQFMRDYLEAGHMEMAPPLKPGEPHYFLPHHAVHRPDDPPQKIRVVFNASQKTISNLSLNDILLPGPKLQLDITSVLTKFRLDELVFLADIKQMFRQVSHPADDRKFLRILWRFDENEPMQEYQLCTVTYGTASAPFLACRVLRELADIHEKSHPNASKILTTRTYVDDINGGSNSIESTLRIRYELQDLLSKAQLELRKWAANDARILFGIPKEHLLPAMHSVSLEIDDKTSLKVLGLSWHPQSDSFHYVLRSLDNVNTKRHLASQIARVYDPLGWLMPLTICARNIFRTVVQNHYDWDDDLPPSVTSDWSQLAKELPCLAALKIPRFISTHDQWLIGFSDASEKAYGAVVYSISVSTNGPSCSLIMSKARIAPIKPMTLPRLELSAALILSKAITKVQAMLNVSDDRVIALSDSEIALSWITAEPAPVWKIFVGNRVADILEHVKASRWFHVPTKENPADHASRGLKPKELMRCHMWWNGPEWLRKPFSQWPVKRIRPVLSNQEVTSEVRTSFQCASVVSALTNGTESLEKRFSSWKTLHHVVALCVRYLEKLKVKRTPLQRRELTLRCQLISQEGSRNKWWYEHIHPITVHELQKAKEILVRRAQAQALHKELIDAQANRPKLRITRFLGLFIDTQGIIRVGGRLRNSQLPDSQKHPALLPSDHPVTRLLIENSHKALFHAGPLSTLHHLRGQFWIVNGKNVVRRQLSKCMRCYTIRPRPFQPEMGQLPAARTQVDFPFSTTGIDYAGPFPVSIAGLRKNNILDCYLAIFVCFATKAVHIEVVTDLSTPGFLQAYHRFVSRRGHPHTVWTDNGRNFLGAANELRRIRNLLLNADHQATTSQEAAAHGTTWKFIPPSAPFFGGLWEAAVKQAKRLLKNCLRDQVPTLETFITITTQVEAILNSRPLTAMSSSPDDLSVLTPAHFLIFRPMTLPPTEPGLDNRTALKNRLKFSQHLLQTFWTRWKKEYLLELQTRSKWDTSGRPARVGDLVLVMNDNTPPLSWTMGKIISIYPGSDGIARVADLRTPSGTLSRPVRKLCPLPVEDDGGTDSSTAGEDVLS